MSRPEFTLPTAATAATASNMAATRPTLPAAFGGGGARFSSTFLAVQAAVEAGWGQRPRRQGAADSNHLSGAKAGSQSQGAVAAATTTEYEGGVALRKVERFRSYPDQASAFRDYASLLAGNPRYQHA